MPGSVDTTQDATTGEWVAPESVGKAVKSLAYGTDSSGSAEAIVLTGGSIPVTDNSSVYGAEINFSPYGNAATKAALPDDGGAGANTQLTFTYLAGVHSSQAGDFIIATEKEAGAETLQMEVAWSQLGTPASIHTDWVDLWVASADDFNAASVTKAGKYAHFRITLSAAKDVWVNISGREGA